MTASDAIRHHNTALESRDPSALLGVLAETSLYEMPLLRGRMVGRDEIAEGLRLAYGAMTACRINLAREREADGTAMAEGVMTATLAHEDKTVEVPFAIVAQTLGDQVKRLSVYLDARPFRLWSPGPVMSPGSSGAGS